MAFPGPLQGPPALPPPSLPGSHSRHFPPPPRVWGELGSSWPPSHTKGLLRGSHDSHHAAFISKCPAVPWRPRAWLCSQAHPSTVPGGMPGVDEACEDSPPLLPARRPPGMAGAAVSPRKDSLTTCSKISPGIELPCHHSESCAAMCCLQCSSEGTPQSMEWQAWHGMTTAQQAWPGMAQHGPTKQGTAHRCLQPALSGCPQSPSLMLRAESSARPSHSCQVPRVLAGSPGTLPCRRPRNGSFCL